MMLQVTPKGENRLDLEFSGKVDSEEMARALDEMVKLSANFENGKMLYRIGDFKLPALGAIGVELSRLPDLFRMIGRFDKVAVVCDQDWLQNIAEVEGKLFPNLDIKGFDRDDEDDAEEWLTD